MDSGSTALVSIVDASPSKYVSYDEGVQYHGVVKVLGVDHRVRVGAAVDGKHDLVGQNSPPQQQNY